VSGDERLREEQTAEDIKLGYIGLGNQGAPMAKRLATRRLDPETGREPLVQPFEGR